MLTGEATITATAEAFVKHADLELPEVLSFTAVGNANSRRVMEKLGLVHHPEEDFDHPNVPEGSRIRPHVYYRITADDYALAG